MRDAGRRVVVVLLAVLLVVLCAAGIAVAEAPVAVSPGHSTHLAQVEARCPTFNWGALPGAESYQLVVYRLGEEGEEAKPALRKTFAGSVTGWTPALDQCLKRGGRYAWTVRAVGKKESSEWSTPALFQVAAPTLTEFEEALAVVRSYLAAQDRAGGGTSQVAEAEPAAELDSEPAATAEAPGTRAAAATVLKVDLGVEAASFKGDGSELTALDPSNLSAGTAGIDITGNAATATTATSASDLACTDCVSESELDFDPSSQGELDAHKASGDHDAAYVNKAGDTMTGTLNFTSASGTAITTDPGRRVGIGRAPIEMLDVEGNIRLSGALRFFHGTYIPSFASATNTALGLHALSNPALTGYDNTALGSHALGATTTGYRNVGIGTGAMWDNTEGTFNVGVGYYALELAKTGFNNVAIGAFALEKGTNQEINTAVGAQALKQTDGGRANTAVGFQALRGNLAGSYSTAVGAYSLPDTDGARNTALGYRTLFNLMTGTDNIAIGDQAGRNVTDGSQNIFIGSQGTATDSGVIRIGGGDQIVLAGGKTFVAGIAGVTTDNEAVPVVVDSAGQLGTASPSGVGVNADLLDSLDSTQFLRSDTDDSLTSGTLSLAGGTTLSVDAAASAAFNNVPDFGASAAPPFTVAATSQKVTNLDADLLDGQDSSAFVSSGSAWLLAGNAGTTPGTDFVGTTDPQALELHANSTRLMSLDVGAVPISEPSPNTPLDILDLDTTVDTITVPDHGLATTFSIGLQLNNSDISDLTITLTDPDMVVYTLWDSSKGGGTEIDTSFPDPEPTVSGDLTTWIGRNPVGVWGLTIVDGDAGPSPDGQLVAWRIEFEVFGDPNVQVYSRLAVDGEISVAGAISGPGVGLTGLNASNLESGTVPSARLSGTYAIDITGNAATATAATSATTATTAADSGLLDSLDSTQFLRSDTSDDYTSGTLSLAGGTTLDVDGALDASGATSVSLPGTTFGADLALQNGETISNSTNQVVRFTDEDSDIFEIDLTASVFLLGKPNSGDFVVKAAEKTTGAGTEVIIKGGDTSAAAENGGDITFRAGTAGVGGFGGVVQVAPPGSGNNLRVPGLHVTDASGKVIGEVVAFRDANDAVLIVIHDAGIPVLLKAQTSGLQSAYESRTVYHQSAGCTGTAYFNQGQSLAESMLDRVHAVGWQRQLYSSDVPRVLASDAPYTSTSDGLGTTCDPVSGTIDGWVATAVADLSGYATPLKLK